MIDIDKVIDVFNSLAGEEVASEYPHFCFSAVTCVYGKLKGGCDIYSNMNPLCYAAGCEAYYRYLLAVSTDTNFGFRAGEITVEQNIEEKLKNAEKLLQSAYADISHLLKPKRFAFRRA